MVPTLTPRLLEILNCFLLALLKNLRLEILACLSDDTNATSIVGVARVCCGLERGKMRTVGPGLGLELVEPVNISWLVPELLAFVIVFVVTLQLFSPKLTFYFLGKTGV